MKGKKTTQQNSLEKVLKIIEEANLVPTTLELPDARQIFYEKVRSKMEQSYFEWQDKLKPLENPSYSPEVINSELNKIVNRAINPLSDFPTFNEAKERYPYGFFEHIGGSYYSCRKETWEIVWEMIESAVNKSSLKSFYDHIQLNLPFVPHDFYIERYAHYCDLRNKVIMLAKYNSAQSQTVESYFSYLCYISINDKGEIVFEKDNFLEAFDRNDARRVKICPNCKTIFWAFRFNQKVCSRRCSNNLHQIKHRIKELKIKLNEADEKLKKQRQNLSFNSPLIKKQMALVNKITKQIEKEKRKNGTL